MKIWRDVGNVGLDHLAHLAAFHAAALEIQKEEGRVAELSKLFFLESIVGEWGDTKRDLPSRVVQLISNEIEPKQVFQATRNGIVPITSPGFPKIATAMENNSVRFLVGNAPDGTRRVAIVIVSQASVTVQRAARRRWWKLW